MNETLKKAIILYSTGNYKEFLEYLNSLSKPTLIGVFTDLLTFYINDKNSSKLRELITALISGYSFSTEKLGYDGYKIESFNKVFCEIKPKNVSLENCKKRKLNANGNFSDYTPERFFKDIKENLNILSSGFVDGKLIYIMEFPFECIANKLKQQLEKKFGKDLKREESNYLRSANFSFNDFKDCNNLRVIFVNKNLEKFKNCLSKNLYNFLKESLKEK